MDNMDTETLSQEPRGSKMYEMLFPVQTRSARATDVKIWPVFTAR